MAGDMSIFFLSEMIVFVLEKVENIVEKRGNEDYNRFVFIPFLLKYNNKMMCKKTFYPKFCHFFLHVLAFPIRNTGRPFLNYSEITCLKEILESVDRCTGRRDVNEIMLKNRIQLHT